MFNYAFNPYNGINNTQNRINQIAQQYPQYVTPAQPQTNPLQIVTVSNIEEAKAFRVDLLGTPTFFYNTASNEMYLKQTNTQTGGADFFTYKLFIEPTIDVKAQTNINTYDDNFKALNDKIDGLYKILQPKQVEEKPIEKAKGVKDAK